MSLRHYILLVGLAGFVTMVHADQLTGCAAKKQNLERKLSIAESHGNQYQARGLRRALSEVEENCTDRGLLQKRQEDVEEAREELRERQEELDETLRDGDYDKVAKREAKLEKARKKLTEAEAALKE